MSYSAISQGKAAMNPAGLSFPFACYSMPLLFLSTMEQPSLEMEGFGKQQEEIPYPLPVL